MTNDLAVAFREHEQADNLRHEENLERFSVIRAAAARLDGQVKVVIALLIANGAINLFGVIH